MAAELNKQSRRKTSFAMLIAAFWFGLACSLPALSMADDADEVVDDLLTYRAEKRAQLEQDSLDVSGMKNDPAAKILHPEKSAKADKTGKDSKSVKLAKPNSTKK